VKSQGSFNASVRNDRRKHLNVPPTTYGSLAQFLTREVQVVKLMYWCAPVFTDSVSAVYCGPKKNWKIKERNGS
jgi:hypothetical protein